MRMVWCRSNFAFATQAGSVSLNRIESLNVMCDVRSQEVQKVSKTENPYAGYVVCSDSATSRLPPFDHRIMCHKSANEDTAPARGPVLLDRLPPAVRGA